MVQLPNEKPADRSDKSFEDNHDSALNGSPVADVDFLNFVGSAESRNQVFMGAIQRTSWQRSIKAYRSEHPPQSKYWTEAYKNRTKLFRPKTRTAVRKNMASAAAAFFSNADVVSIKAQFDDDPVKLASAAVLHELLNYRLNRTTAKSGTPWFMTCMGANQDSQIHGICISKQYWEYETVSRETDQPMVDGVGQPVLDEDGEPRTEKVDKEVLVKDRPMILLMPPENVMVDPAAPWFDPAQGSGYFIAMHPMTIDECKTMLANPGKGNEQWIEVNDDVLRQASQDYATKGVRLARGGGTDRYDNRTDDQGNDSGIVWMYENFFRVRGEDYHFWSVGRRAYASKVRRTIEAYPEQLGERPYVYGYGQIEAHQTFPMSAVEAWLQMQMEINEQVNLSIDIMKQRLSPIATVTQGSMFDWKQLQKRGGPDATIIVRKQDDLNFVTPPDGGATPYTEMAHLNGDFDDLSGTMSGGSVANNRQMNETVGGMRLLNGAANSVTEYDLRVFAQSWAEPTLRQTVRLIQYYETDETAFAIAGQKAKMLERFGVSSITDQDLMHEVTLSVNVGIGASDPFQRLQKLQSGLQMIAQGGQFMKGLVRLVPEPFIREVMGAVGYTDGLRFFEIKEDQPSMMQLQMMMKMALEQAKLDTQMKIAQARDQTQADVWHQRALVQLLDTIIAGMQDTQAIQTEAILGAQRYIHDNLVQQLLKLPTAADSVMPPAFSGAQPGPPGAAGQPTAPSTGPIQLPPFATGAQQ